MRRVGGFVCLGLGWFVRLLFVCVSSARWLPEERTKRIWTTESLQENDARFETSETRRDEEVLLVKRTQNWKKQKKKRVGGTAQRNNLGDESEGGRGSRTCEEGGAEEGTDASWRCAKRDPRVVSS